MTEQKKPVKRLRKPEPRTVPGGPGREASRSKTQLTEDGREQPNPRPIAPPPGYVKRPAIHEMIRDMVRRELSAHAANAGHESFEEADDFDMADDPLDPRSPYEVDFDPWYQAQSAAREAGRAEPANEPAPTDPPAATIPPSSPGGGGAPGGSQATPPGDPPVTPESPAQASPRQFKR